ncbi:MAG: glutamate dehydrogenase, partial [Gammaproteobacteria bacterium]|nr:glutamate dehydrogenase [Gammaproteobacteria bacterium]
HIHDARQLVANQCIALAEGANMPCSPAAIRYLRKQGVLYGPGKAANAGGVAISALEMSQNSQRLSWSAEELESRLKVVMRAIHAQCVKYGKDGGQIDYLKGANIAGFRKVAEAMLAYGVV